MQDQRQPRLFVWAVIEDLKCESGGSRIQEAEKGRRLPPVGLDRHPAPPSSVWKGPIAAEGADKFGRQRAILFMRNANVRACFNLSEEISKRCRPKRVKRGNEVSTPSAINGL